MSVDPKRAMQLLGEQALQIALMRDEIAARDAVIQRLTAAAQAARAAPLEA